MMRNPKALWLTLASLGLTVGITGSSTAGTMFNQTISDFNGGGSGIPNTNFETTAGIDGALIGLGVTNRFSGVLPVQTNDGTTATYFVQTGLSPDAPSPSPTPLSIWNLNYYINFGTSDAYTTASLSGTGLDGQSLGGPISFTANAQDSTNLGYLPLPLTSFNPNAAGTYTFTLTLGGGTAPELSETINVTASPEPSTLISGAIAGVACLGFAWRRRRSPNVTA